MSHRLDVRPFDRTGSPVQGDGHGPAAPELAALPDRTHHPGVALPAPPVTN